MIREEEIRDAIQHYLSGQSLEEFEEWLAVKSWNMHQDSDPAVQKVVGNIQALIAEHDYGHLSEALLRQRLNNLIAPPVVSFHAVNDDPASEEVSLVSSSSVQIPPFGMPLSTVFSS
jgi:hypothetical protein